MRVMVIVEVWNWVGKTLLDNIIFRINSKNTNKNTNVKRINNNTNINKINSNNNNTNNNNKTNNNNTNRNTNLNRTKNKNTNTNKTNNNSTNKVDNIIKEPSRTTRTTTTATSTQSKAFKLFPGAVGRPPHTILLLKICSQRQILAYAFLFFQFFVFCSGLTSCFLFFRCCFTFV